MTKLRNFIGLFLVSLVFFTACKKESITPTDTNIPTAETPTTAISNATGTRAMMAATMQAHSRNGGENDTTFNDCGCYDLFDGVDFDASHEEIEAAVDAILATLSEEEITRLFEPVCTDDGEIYESACIADCEGITNYHICTDEELDDYFFGDFDCEDLDSLTFPTEIELPDGTLVTVNSEEELFDVIDQWFETNGEEWEEDLEDYEDLLDDCFTVVFPIQIQFPDGTIISYDTEEALYTGVELWYDTNPESYEDPIPVYPFDVTLADGTTQTISSEMDEEALWETCFGDIDFDLCFTINYPITLVYPDGTTLAVNSDEELETAVDTFYEANPDTETDIDVQYPITITLEDGTEQVIENEEALDAALEACFTDDYDGMGRLAKQSKRTTLSAKRVVKGALLSGSKTH